MYQALYRKYRPIVFEDVVGQEHVVQTVKNQIINNKISHAYMFTGTRGTGKTTCAKILARAVNCENPIDGNPCNQCETCKGILNGSLLDVFEIDAASNTGVDNIRELRDDVIFTPASAKYKVYIIDEVHMLTMQAFNALLKTLEEPPAHIIFVFATTEIHKVPQTILSRCQRFDFKRITLDDICKRLKYIANQEGFSIDDKACSLIAKIADGAMRDALSVLDRCIDASGVVDLQKVEQTVGICPYDEIMTAFDHIINCDTEGILKLYAETRKNSRDTISLFTDMCSYLRDMIIIKMTENPLDLLSYDGEKFDTVKETANRFTIESILRSISVLQNGIYDISKMKDKQIMAEMALIKLTNPKIGEDYESLNARLSLLESGQVTISQKKTVNNSTLQQDKSVIEEKQPIATQTNANRSNDDFWHSLIDSLNSIGGRAFSVFLKNIEHSVEDEIIKIKCSKDDFAYSVLTQQSNVVLIKQAAKIVSGKDYSITFTEYNIAPKMENDSLSELLDNANDILYEE